MNQHMASFHGIVNGTKRARNRPVAVRSPVAVVMPNALPTVTTGTSASGNRGPLLVSGNIRGRGGGVGAHSLASTELGNIETQAGFHNTLKDVIVDRLGFRPDSSAYLMKALHPMDEELFGGTRIPDATTDSTVALELRTTSNFSKPTGAGDGAWDLDVYFPPFPDVAYAYQARKAGEPRPDQLTWVFYPTTGPGKLGNNQSVLNSNADTYRGVYRGATFQMTASSLNNDGEVYAGQYGVKFRDLTVPERVDSTGAITRHTTSLFYCDSVPKTTDQLVQKVSGYVQMPAKCGLYLPIRYTDPVHLYQEGQGTPIITGVNPEGHQADEVADGDTLASAPVNFMMGVVMFRGLNSNATIALKCRTGLEAVPDANGTWGAFSESSPIYDREVMDTVVQLRHTLALAYPASYNDLGAIWKAISSGFEALARPTWGATRSAGRFLGRIGVPLIARFGRGLETASDQLLAGLDAATQ